MITYKGYKIPTTLDELVPFSNEDRLKIYPENDKKVITTGIKPTSIKTEADVCDLSTKLKNVIDLNLAMVR